jgi:hypothetical protein
MGSTMEARPTLSMTDECSIILPEEERKQTL